VAPGRAGTEIEELTAKPEGGRSDTLGVGAGPASDRIRSPAIVPAGIATPNARSAPAVGHRSTRTFALHPNLPSQPAGRRLDRVQARGCPAPGSLFKGSGSDLRDLR